MWWAAPVSRRHCRSGLGHDHRHQHRSHLGLRLLDAAQLLAPTEQLADMDTGRAGNLRDHRIKLKAGGDKPLVLFARPATAALSLVLPLLLPTFSATSQGGLHRELLMFSTFGFS